MNGTQKNAMNAQTQGNCEYSNYDDTVRDVTAGLRVSRLQAAWTEGAQLKTY